VADFFNDSGEHDELQSEESAFSAKHSATSLLW